MINFLKKKTHNKALNDYLACDKFAKKEKVKNIEFLALDFETTGLNYKTDRVISMGWVVIKNLAIDLKTIKHTIINPKDELKDSVLIHKITDDEVIGGISISKAFDDLLKVMQNRVLVVHFDNIEKNFINYISYKLYGIKKLPMQMVDTLRLQLKKYNSMQTNVESLRLYNLRKKYNLPRYKAHNSSVDALATAELFLAQLSYSGNLDDIKLKEVI